MISLDLANNIFVEWNDLVDKSLKINCIQYEEIIAAGSVRRQKENVRDLDILVKLNKDISAYEFDLVKNSILAFSKNAKKISSHRKNWIRVELENYCIPKIDIFIPSPKNYYTSKIFATGSSHFNRKIRGLSKNKNKYFSYDFPVGDLEINSERDYFDFLGIDYVEPNKR